MDKLKIIVNDSLSFEVSARELEELDRVHTGEDAIHVLKDARSYEVKVLETDFPGTKLTIQVNGNAYVAEISDPYDQLVNKMGLTLDMQHKVDEIRAPMPGLVLQLLAGPGDEVKRGEALLILEAMKMENVIKSPGDGVIGQVSVEKGQAVDKGQVLFRMQ